MNSKDDLLAQGRQKQLSIIKSGSSLSPGKSPTKRGQVKITYNSVKHYIMEDPKNRQFYDIQRMQQYFRTLPYFDKICSKLDITRQTSVLEKFCKKLRYMTQLKGEFLYKQNEKSEYFYILLDGKASVLIPKREDVIDQEKSQIPSKLSKPMFKQVQQFYETSPSNRLKNFLSKNNQQQPSLNRLSITNLLKEDLPAIILSQRSPLSNQTPSTTDKKNQTLFNLQTISPIRQQSINPSPFKLKSLAEQSLTDLNVVPPQKNAQSKSRTSLLNIVTKTSQRESMRSMQYLEQSNPIIPKVIKQSLPKEYWQIIDQQTSQFDQAVEGESEYYGEQYDNLFDGFVFKFTFGKILNSGEAIGGVDILSNKSRREAVLCLDDCELGFISKTDYIEILKEIEESKFNKKLNRLIESLDPEIPHLRRLMGRMVSYLKKEQYKRGQVIYQQNEAVKGCYLITQGEIEIIKELIMIPPENHIEKYAHRQIQPNKQMHTLASISAGQYIGEEELLLDSEYRNSSAVCKSYECKVYFIEKAHFSKLISDQIDIRLAFEKTIKQKENFNTQKFQNLQRIIQNNYNAKFQQRDTTSKKHLMKYKDDQNQFRDCFQKIIYLEKEVQRKKEIPSSQERIGGVGKEKIVRSPQSSSQKKRIVFKKKSNSEINLKDKQLNTLNITLKIKEHQNNTAEALTDHYIKLQNQIQQQQQQQNHSKTMKRSVSFNFATQPDEDSDKNIDENQLKQNENKPKLDMVEYLLKGNKHAKCQVNQYLKKLQKKESNKEKMSKTIGSTFFLGVYSKITEDFNNKRIQEEQNQIFLHNNQPNVQDQSKCINNKRMQSSQQNNNQENQQEKYQFSGPISKPYTPDLEVWRRASIKKQNQNGVTQIQNQIQNDNMKNNSSQGGGGLSHNQNKLNSILFNLSHNRNHELHLIKSHKCFSKQSHINVQQLIKKSNQIVTLQDFHKQATVVKTQPDLQVQQSQLDQCTIISGQKHSNLFEDSQSQVYAKSEGQIQNQNPQSSSIETYIKQLDEASTVHFNQVFKPKQRALSAKNMRSGNYAKIRSISTEKNMNLQNSTTNGSNYKYSRNDLSFDSKLSNNKSVGVIVVNHMGQPRKYVC